MSVMCASFIFLFFFFFKQKTAYEMRISDWSSDVCSSDLGGLLFPYTVSCWGWVWGVGWCRLLFENYTVDASIFVARQATKGTWWMPWHQEPMKDVGACDKPRGVGNRALFRGFPNGETQMESCPVTAVKIGRTS